MGVQVGRVGLRHPTKHWRMEIGAQVTHILALCLA